MKTSRLLLLLSLAVPLLADVRLPAILSDHMVLQQGMPVRIWGQAAPAESVTVTFAGQTVAAKADADGKWAVFLQPLKAADPAVMTVTGANRIEIQDVLVGEVWHASGQSNMQMSVAGVNDAATEIANARQPRIRAFRPKMVAIEGEAWDVPGSWQVASPETVGSFSAVGYFFARHLMEKRNVGVGIIDTSWGGKPVQSYTRRRALEAEPLAWPTLENWAKAVVKYPVEREKFEQAKAAWEVTAAAARKEGKPLPPMPGEPNGGPNNPRMPASIYNGMVAPVVPYAVRGAIWYQGESNASELEAFLYRKLFRLMIEDWRRVWDQGDMPFLFVQLANFKANPWWPVLRESQTDALNLRQTGMAVTIDIGDSGNIHPKNKQEVGRRLALLARRIAYGETLVASGPMYSRMTVEGSSIRLWFNEVGGGLQARGGGALTGFTIAGAGGRFVPAEARVDGATVVVSSPEVVAPGIVRYGWADDPVCNLINAEGLPASPFRTDFRTVDR